MRVFIHLLDFTYHTLLRYLLLGELRFFASEIRKVVKVRVKTDHRFGVNPNIKRLMADFGEAGIAGVVWGGSRDDTLHKNM